MPLIPLLKNTALDILSPEFLSKLSIIFHPKSKGKHYFEGKIKNHKTG
jgi:hypothetical protein